MVMSARTVWPAGVEDKSVPHEGVGSHVVQGQPESAEQVGLLEPLSSFLLTSNVLMMDLR